MPTGHIMMAMSLDGFVARTNHTLDWLDKQQTGGEDHGFEEFQDSIDVIVMGSGSFRTLLGFDQWAYNKPVVVLSRSLNTEDIPNELKGKVEISVLEPNALVKSLEVRGLQRVYVDGGAIIRSFLKAGYVNDMRITIVPILIGDGIRLFGELDADVDLKLETVERFDSGLVDLKYRLR